MWCKFRPSSGADEETNVNGFSTNSLFKISSDEVVGLKSLHKKWLSFLFLILSYTYFRLPKTRPLCPRSKTAKWFCPLTNRCSWCPTNSSWIPVKTWPLDRQSMRCVSRKVVTLWYAPSPMATFMVCILRERRFSMCKILGLLYQRFNCVIFLIRNCNRSIAENDIAEGGGRTFVGINHVNGCYFLGCTTGRMYR